MEKIALLERQKLIDYGKMRAEQQKITLGASRDIPFDKRMLSQSNVNQVRTGVSIEELTEGLVRRTLLSAITVQPVLDESGADAIPSHRRLGGPRGRDPVKVPIGIGTHLGPLWISVIDRPSRQSAPNTRALTRQKERQ